MLDGWVVLRHVLSGTCPGAHLGGPRVVPDCLGRAGEQHGLTPKPSVTACTVSLPARSAPPDIHRPPAVSPHPHQVPGNRHLLFVAAFCGNTGTDLEGRGLLVAGYSWDRAPVCLPELGTCPPHDREGRLHGADWPPAAEPSGTAASGFSACTCWCS